MNKHLNEHVTSNFTWGELICSQTLDTYNALHPTQPISNLPNSSEQAHLRYLCEQYLQPLRDKFGPIRLNSAFRSTELNKLVGGTSGSWHTYGSAADIYLPSVLIGVQMMNFIHQRFLMFGIGSEEVVLSKRGKSYWLHLAYNAKATPLGSTTCYNSNRLRMSMQTYR